MESQLTEKLRNISEREYRVEVVVNGLAAERLYQENPDTLALRHGGHSQTPYFP